MPTPIKDNVESNEYPSEANESDSSNILDTPLNSIWSTEGASEKTDQLTTLWRSACINDIISQSKTEQIETGQSETQSTCHCTEQLSKLPKENYIYFNQSLKQALSLILSLMQSPVKGYVAFKASVNSKRNIGYISTHCLMLLKLLVMEYFFFINQ